jgi:hypothetical protein
MEVSMSGKKIKEFDDFAKAIIETSKGIFPKRSDKNPAAVALGRLGGLKGGRARADKLSPSVRKEIAQKAAQARWRGK